MEIAIDEWLPEYISDPQKCQTTFEFLAKVLRKCDRFVTIRGEKLDQKMWKMAKDSGNWDPRRRRLVRWFMASFRHNSRKFHMLEESTSLQLPPELARDSHRKDLYLIRAAVSTGKLVLTTDARLKEKLSTHIELDIRMAEDFINSYDC